MAKIKDTQRYSGGSSTAGSGFTGSMGAGAGIGGFSAMIGGYFDFRQAQTAQRSAEFNASMLDLQAQDAISRGELETTNRRQIGKSILGQQRAGYSGQGVDVSSGTAAILQEQTGQMAEEDAMRIKLDAMRQAWGLRSQASMMRWEADQNLSTARKKAVAGVVTGVAQGAMMGMG